MMCSFHHLMRRGNGPIVEFTVIALVLLGGVFNSIRSNAVRTPTLTRANRTDDPSYLPIEKEELFKQIEAASHDAVQMYILVNRGTFNGHTYEMIPNFTQMLEREPNNPIIIMALRETLTAAMFDEGPRPANGPDLKLAGDVSQREDPLDLDPKLWWAHLRAGEHEIFVSQIGNDKQLLHSGIAHMREAIRLAPNLSIVHFAFVGILQPGLFNNGCSTKEAWAEAQKALKLKPVLADAWLSAAYVQDVGFHNIAKSHEYAMKFLDYVPPDKLYRLWRGKKALLGMKIEQPK